MNAIEQKTYELIQTIKDSEYYKTFEYSLEKVVRQPEVKGRLDEFRARTFRMYNELDEVDLYDETDKIEREHRELRRIPEVNAFLDAEYELCKLLKSTEDMINMAIDVQIPEL